MKMVRKRKKEYSFMTNMKEKLQYGMIMEKLRLNRTLKMDFLKGNIRSSIKKRNLR